VAALARYVADFCEPDGIEGETAITALGTIADALPALMGKGARPCLTSSPAAA
jgi:hypothetical protein